MPMESSSDIAKSPAVLSIECLKGTSKADEWTGDMLQTGDIVEEIRIGSSGSAYSAPFKNGRSGVQKILHASFKSKETSISVRVRRGRAADEEVAELQACIVPESGSRKQYVLRSIVDPNYVVGFLDRSEADCFELQASRGNRIASALSKAKLQDGYVSYPWARRMHELLAVPNSSCFLSMLLLPKSLDRGASRYNELEDTLARANAWLSASQASGVPIVFMNIQTESLLTKISGETASSTYVWYAPLCGEHVIEVKIKDGDAKLGFAISRTEEGFIYISSVIDGDENVPSTRSGLSNLYREAISASRLLVVSRVSNQKVLPWMISSTGAIRCFDTVSLSQKLSLHRHAKVPILIHVLLWNRTLASASSGITRLRSVSPPVVSFPPEVQSARHPNENQVSPLPLEEVSNEAVAIVGDERERRLERDTAGEVSFRFHDFSLANNWV